MGTLGDEMKKEYAKMSTADLKGVKAQGQKAVTEYVKGIAKATGVELPEEMYESNAQDMLHDINQELEKRGE